ncbi:MAG: DNA alkylation repair protein [Fimbriimonadaceae bacterium]|nr:DNA alkylation repair protein [Fimbriimonadaceae bacterium]
MTDSALVKAKLPEIVERIEDRKARQTGALRSIMREVLEEVKQESGREVLELANALQRVEGYRYRLISNELVARHKAAFALLNQVELERLGEGLASWWDVDVFACELTGPAWLKGQISDQTVEAWARLQDVWWRRTSLVSTIKLSRATAKHPEFIEKTIYICELHVDDREDTIIKALSWALRELAKKNPAVVQDFTEKHNTRLAARVKREVSNKLTTGVKNPRNQVK